MTLAMSFPAFANNLCVNQKGVSGCYTTIGAAVAAASPNDTIKVAAGTYKEFVTISKPVSLVGESPESTTIDAVGYSNGIYVNNGSQIIVGVVITGFSIENANYEGILVNGAAGVTIWWNRVAGNDKLLQPSPTNPVCPNLTTVYPFEQNEQDDCGEGVHLTNVSESVVAFNLLENNSGGVLVSDDTGPTHDNSIRNNVVRNNVFDCGITMPSHTPYGVYHNTVSSNTVTGNGTDFGNGGGAGVGIFSPGGPTVNYGNSVVGNYLVGNGIAGVAMHTHAPGTEVLRDEIITGNFIADNGYDSDLGLTSSQTDGITLLTVGGSVGGFVISENTFQNEAEDIAISTNVPLTLTATLNNFSSNSIAIDNLGPTPGSSGSAVTGNALVEAKEDWWGCPAGPGALGCATISNMVKSGPMASKVFATPWLGFPLPETPYAAPNTPQ
jgi:hypothetical protein